MKKIKKSQRGLTFSTNNSDKIGSKFRYIIDKKNCEILIIEDENGTGTVSRKKGGKCFKPLYDIRSKEVRDIVSSADYMEVEELADKIVVHIYKAVKKAVRSNIVHIKDILAVKTGEIVLDAVSGMSAFDISYLQKTSPVSWDYKKERNHIQHVYDTISLFSGAGMLDYGFKDPRVRFVFANDACIIDGKYQPGIKDTYEYNMKHKLTIGDIRSIDTDSVPPAELIIGGPCCQGYSNIVSDEKKRYSELAESKRLLIDDYVRFVRDKRPKVFVIENVPALLTEKDGMYISKHVVDVLSDYEITSTIIKDCNVGGYSIRQRAIIIGSKIGKIELPSGVIHTVKTVRDALLKVDETWPNWNEGSEPKDGTKMLMRYVPDGGNYKDIPEDAVIKYRSTHTPFTKDTQSQNYRRLDPDRPACTITNWRKACMMPPREFGIDRQLTVSEVAAIQGLPKEFKLFGSIGTMQQMLGNGVTQAMARLVKDTVLDAMDKRISLTKCYT